MNAKLTFISAGAGSGKTHRLTQILYDELSSGRARPMGVIATTFTRKAATELRERARDHLIKQGDFTLANSIGQAKIGTVNAVCGELLRRFAFEAGLPTEQTVLEEEQATLLLMQAIDTVQEGQSAARLAKLNHQLSKSEWKEDFTQLVATVRANGLRAEDMATMSDENIESLLIHFPKPRAGELTTEMIAALKKALPLIRNDGGTTKQKATYLREAENFLRELGTGRAEWREWIKISKDSPSAQSRSLVDDIVELGANAPAHSGLHAELREYLIIQFDLCGKVLDAYQQIKIDRGVIDFTDQEHLLLQLLEHPFVSETLKQELDLLMVDEFQDTSPIQLALFMKLMKLAKRVFWVGDIKQAIYGFRGSDTALMQAVVSNLDALGGKKERLSDSWRSRRPLVELVNEAFVPAFGGFMSKEDIELTPRRDEDLTGAPYGFWKLPGRVEDQITRLADGLRQLVASGYEVYDKPLGMIRPMTLGDIAILRRSNDKVTKTAAGLRAAGLPVMTEQPGLLATPEAVLALACLRRLNDRGDTLASAEIISLADCEDPEDWVADRLRYLGEDHNTNEWRETGDQAHPILARLATLRSQMAVMSPSEALETAIVESQLPARVLQWNSSVDRGRVRLANLDALIALARQYESVCEGGNHAASVSGLLIWLDEQVEAGTDSLALPAIDAIQVMTHHKSKGLEWPVVVLMDLEGDIKDGIWDNIHGYSRGSIDSSNPLNNRGVRYWPWPFGAQKNVPFRDELMHKDVGKQFVAKAEQEALRVLYVSMTRARDLMIIAAPERKTTGPWIEALKAPWLSNIGEDGKITLPSGKTVQTLPLPMEGTGTATGSGDALYWFSQPAVEPNRLPLIFNPSSADSPPMRVVETVEIGTRIQVDSDLDWADVGHAVHAALALACITPDSPVTTDEAENILKAYGLTGRISGFSLATQAKCVSDWLCSRWPGSRALPEWPVQMRLENRQVLNGRIDLLLDCGEYWILIDHKSNPGPRSGWPALADKHGGQLLSYKLAVEQATSKPVREMWLIFAVSGGGIRIEAA